MLTRHDVGYRVTIRRLLPEYQERSTFGEVIGDLVEFTETDLLVMTAQGLVTIPHALVRAARRMPDHRQLSATGRLQQIAAMGWPAPDVSYLGDWVLRRVRPGWRLLRTRPEGCPQLGSESSQVCQDLVSRESMTRPGRRRASPGASSPQTGSGLDCPCSTSTR